MIRYKQNTQNKKKIQNFLENISLSIEVLKAVDKLGTINTKGITSKEKEEKFRKEIEKIKKNLKKNIEKKNFKNSKSSIDKLRSDYPTTETSLYEMFAHKLKSNGESNARESLHYIKSYQKTFVERKTVDELKLCKKFYNEKNKC